MSWTAATSIATSIAACGILAGFVRKRILLKRKKDEEAEEAARKTRNLELEMSKQQAREEAREEERRQEAKQKDYERRVQLSRTPLREYVDESTPNDVNGSNSSKVLCGTFWNRMEVMHSVLFPLIRFAMREQSYGGGILKLDWQPKYETIPTKRYESDPIAGYHWMPRHIHVEGRKWNLATGCFELEYYTGHPALLFNCRIVSISATSLRIVFESDVTSTPDSPGPNKMVCWQIPITLSRPYQSVNANASGNTLDVLCAASAANAANASHVELAKLLDPTIVSDKQFDSIFGTRFVKLHNLLKYADIVHKSRTNLPTPLRQLTFEYAN